MCSYGCVRRTYLKQILGSSSPSKKFIGAMLEGVHLSNSLAAASQLIFNWFTIAAIALVYWRIKKVCSYGCVRRMHLKQIFVNSSPSKTFIGTILWGVHLSNSLAAVSPLIFNWFFIAAIALVYWRSKRCVAMSVYDERTWNKFCQLLSIQEVHWFHTWRRSSFEHPGISISTDIQLIFYICHSTSVLE